MKLLKMLLIMFLVLVLVLPTNIISAKPNVDLLKSTKISTWLWDTSEIVTDSDKIINFLVEKKVKVLYLQIDYTLKNNYYKSFIANAGKKNIAVYALDGSANWASPDGDQYRIKFFNWVTNYQKNSLKTQRFKGVHLDVEPYLNENYEKNSNLVLAKYQECLLKSKISSKKLKLDFSIDIPFWFYKTQYNNKYGNGNLAEWIFKNVKAVTIMAYRDSSMGVIEISKAQMDLSKKYKVKATIAVETGKSSEGDFVTFYEEGQTYMYNQLRIVANKYNKSNAFDGVAIHYLNSWMNMKK